MYRRLCLVTAIGLSTLVPAARSLGADAPDSPLASSDSWSDALAGHLLRRAGFGGTPEQIAYLERLGRKGAVSYLVEYERIAADPVAASVASYEPLERGMADLSREERQKLRNERRRLDQLQFSRVVRAWIKTMVSTPRPLEEKLTLFWHGHLTSGYREVKFSRAMYDQNRLLRRHASGNFRDLLLDITDDPAMILYLNTQQNRKGKPNENYARELMELFTMGEGNYTERDIKEAARAFTGIAVDRRSGETVYRDGLHDFGEKTFLGHTGDLQPVDIIDIILEQPATAEYMARKLWTFFAYEDPEPPIVQALAKVLRDSGYAFKPALTAMFTSDAFYSDRARFTHIKSPVELMVGTMRMLDIPAMDTGAMGRGLERMGQMLMQPPNVKGWDGGASWITTSTLFDRYNVLGVVLEGTDTPPARRQRQRLLKRLEETFGGEAALGPNDVSPTQPAYDPMPVVQAENLRSAPKVVDYFVKRLLQRPIDRNRRKVLIDALLKEVGKRKMTSPQNAGALRGLIHLIMSMPEYQLS